MDIIKNIILILGGCNTLLSLIDKCKSIIEAKKKDSSHSLQASDESKREH